MPAHDRMTDPQGQSDLLLYRLYRIHATVGPLVALICERDYGVTRREWRVLLCLADVDGVLCSELADFAMLDRARTSRTLSRLVDKRLVRREPKPSDRREVRVYLTDEGRRIYTGILPRIAAFQCELLAPLSVDQRAKFSEMMDLLQAQAHRMNPGGERLLPLEDAGGDT